MKRYLAPLMAAVLVLSLAACGGEKAPPPMASQGVPVSPPGSGSQEPGSGSPESSSGDGGSESSSASDGPDLAATGVRIGMQVQEYPGNGYAQAVEIPLLTGQGPGVEVANTPFRQQAEERQRLLSQGSGELLEIRAYPFTREDWVQVLTTTLRYESDATIRVESANYDAKAGAFVTPAQALERLSLTAEGLEQRLMAQDLQPEEYQTELLHLWQPSAFYVRQDGSMVFFFIAEFLIVGNPDAMGPRTLVCYDSARGEFSLGAPGELLTGEGPDTLSPPL